MKIVQIKTISNRIYEVSFEPNFIEKLFGIKPKTKRYKDTGSEYLFGSATVYVDQTGKKLSNGNRIGTKIDQFRNSFI